ncbi:FtsW/RodA/SpoVE family cell cycle protein, partial [Streptomyces thermoviolaceus]
PIAGVPLPLFSYGGSALLPTMFAIGLLIAFARDEPAARAALAMRQPRFGRKRTSGSAAGRTTGRKPGRGSGRTPGRASARASGGSSGRGTGQGSGQGPRRWNTMRRRASAARPSGER